MQRSRGKSSGSLWMRTPATAALGCVLGCGDDFGPVGEICNGSQDRTLSVVVAVNIDRVAEGSVMLNENGASFVHVRGDCRNWVGGSGGLARTGQLDGLAKKTLARELFYGQWESRARLCRRSFGSWWLLLFSRATRRRAR
jgi:hypothetical protein